MGECIQNEESDIEDHEIDVELRVLQHQFTEQVNIFEGL